MQPAGKNGMIRELLRILRQDDKRTLSHIFRQVGVANHPERGRINKINVPSHEFGQSRFRTAFRVLAQ